tara:strand:+ start:336 stop:623 length:288 start_codon:yes stop_codon:yes gene_type:complete
MNNNFRAQFRKFGPMVISIFGMLMVVFCLVACALSAQRHKAQPKNTPVATKDQPIVEVDDILVELPVSIQEFEYDGTVYLLIEKDKSNSFSVILK